MPKQITVRGVSKELADRLKKLSAARNESLNATVLNQIGLTSEQITGLGLTPTGRVIEELL